MLDFDLRLDAESFGDEDAGCECACAVECWALPPLAEVAPPSIAREIAALRAAIGLLPTGCGLAASLAATLGRLQTELHNMESSE